MRVRSRNKADGVKLGRSPRETAERKIQKINLLVLKKERYECGSQRGVEREESRSQEVNKGGVQEGDFEEGDLARAQCHKENPS